MKSFCTYSILQFYVFFNHQYTTMKLIFKLNAFLPQKNLNVFWI